MSGVFLRRILEEEPGFFDDEETKENYRKMVAALSNDELEKLKSVKEDMANIPPPPAPEENEEEVFAEPPNEAPPKNLVGDFIDSNCSYQEYRESLTAEEVIEFETEMEQMQNLPVEELLLGEWDEAENYFNRCIERAEQKKVNSVPARMLPCKAVSSSNNPKAIASAEVVTEGYEEFAVGSYAYINSILYHMVNEKEGMAIANFFIKILKEKISVHEEVNEQNCVIDSIETTTWEIAIFCLGETFTAEVTIASLYNEKEILKITKDRGFVEQSKEAKDHLKKFLNDVIRYRKCPTVREYTSTGWMRNSDGMWHYLTDSGVIGHPELNMRAKVPLHFLYNPEMVGSKEAFEEFYKLRNLCPKKMEHSTFLMHYTALSVMATLYQEIGHGINFVVALIGPTNSRKTSSAIVFSRIFDRTPKAVADIRFDSTEVAIREKMESYGDAILLVDDFLPLGDKASLKDQMKKSETLIRGYGDRVPRMRSKAYAKAIGIKEFNRVKGCCMITGEIFDTNSESSQTRVVQIPFECGDVDLDLLSHYQKNLLNVPTFVYDFICFIEQNIELVFEIIKGEVDNIRRDKNVKIKVPRFRDTLGIIKAEICIFYMYAKLKGFMSNEEINEAKIRDEELVKKLICLNDDDTKVKSPAAIICTALQKAIEKNRLQVVSEMQGENLIDFTNVIIENDDYYIVLSETLQRVYAIYCRETNRDVLYSDGRKISGPLKKENAILVKEESDGTRATHKIKGETSKRFLFIKKNKFNQFCNLFDEF